MLTIINVHLPLEAYEYTQRFRWAKGLMQKVPLYVTLISIFNNNNKCNGDDTKAGARQSPNCIKNKTWRKTILNMADGIITPCNVARSWHWFRQVTAPCNVAGGPGMTCHGIRPNVRQIGILHLVSILTISPQSTCHSAPVCKILSKSDHIQKKWRRSCRFSRWGISVILDFRGPVMGSLKSTCTTSYKQLYSQIICSK